MTRKPRKPDPGKAGDDDLWGRVAAGIKPLKGHHKNRTPEVAPAPVAPGPSSRGRAERRHSRPAAAAVGTAAKRPVLPDLRHDSHAGVDKNTAKRLKRGQQRIEGRMDLHGMTREQAHRALNAFIDGAYASGKRCVLVITGKGLKEDGTVGVLRAEAPRWLNQSPNRERVLAISHATPKDGGEGALYVMLKRKR